MIILSDKKMQKLDISFKIWIFPGYLFNSLFCWAITNGFGSIMQSVYTAFRKYLPW